MSNVLTAAVVTAPVASVAPSAVSGSHRTWLRIEGAVTLAAAVALYRGLGGGWGTFALLFLVPDLSLLGYLAGARVGAIAYNVGHSLVGPALLAAIGFAAGAPFAVLAACIWVAHVGFDRMLGYGLKATSAFGDTHLGRVGVGGAASRARSDR
jgi:hypothetical protein